LGIASVVAGLYSDAHTPPLARFLEGDANAGFLLLGCADRAGGLGSNHSNPEFFILLGRLGRLACQTQHEHEKHPGQYDKRKSRGIRTTH
jgi:hypothetical protein